MFKLHHNTASLHEVILLDIDFHYLTVEVSFQDQLHLHRLHCQNWLTLLHHISHLTVHLCHCSWHRRTQSFVTHSLAFLSCLHLIRFKSETKLISNMVEYMNNIFLNEVLLMSDLTIDYQSEFILVGRLNLIVISLAIDSYYACMCSQLLHLDVPVQIFAKRSIMDWYFLQLLLVLNITEVDQIFGEIDFASVIYNPGHNCSYQIKGINFCTFMKQSVDILLDESGIVVSLLENSIVEHSLQKSKIIVESYQFIVSQCFLHQFNSFSSVFTIRN